MFRIKKIKFHNHPILKDLELDFCDATGRTVDTVIIAGENGTGKSSLIEYIYGFVSGRVITESNVVLEKDGVSADLFFEFDDEKKCIWVRDNQMKTLPGHDNFKKKYPICGIFSDVDINFHSTDVKSVTSLNLDESNDSRRSDKELPSKIKQLLIDIQNLDDSTLAREIRSNKTKSMLDLKIDERMTRFSRAFELIFDDLKYDRIENENNHKTIYFKKYGLDIPIDDLSSGEKQIVYRGCFLLQDVNAINGAFVFIDEPEISLHPIWQQKIIDYYKNIFTDCNGNQTSQLFVVTHSPFVIHNKNRKNDKVIILQRNEIGEIEVSDRNEYYKCDSIEAVEDAFHIDTFSSTSYQASPTVYLEGRTDEKYFRKACEVFGYSDLPFTFKWVGYMSGDNEVNTGKDSVEKAYHFLIAQNLNYKNICLFDNDVNKNCFNNGNVFVHCLKKYERLKMKIGIENVLRLDDVDVSDCYDEKEKTGNYGEKTTVQSLNKMKCCEKICSMDNEELKVIFADLKNEIDDLIKIYTGEHNET